MELLGSVWRATHLGRPELGCGEGAFCEAVRMVFEHRDEYASEWEALGSIGSKIGCTAETLRKWVRQAEIDSGRRGGLSMVRPP